MTTLPARVVETYLGVSGRTVAARLPNLVVGTAGGGTNLPTQHECLAICAALVHGRFIEAHRKNRLIGRRDSPQAG